MSGFPLPKCHNKIVKIRNDNLNNRILNFEFLGKKGYYKRILSINNRTKKISQNWNNPFFI